MKNKYLILAVSVLTSLFLIGCGKNNKAYEYYENEVQTLYETIVTTDSALNNLDVNKETSVDDFFDSISKLKQSFSDFAAIDAPEEFDNCELLSSKAVDFLESAEINFHSALDNGYNEEYFNAGVANYNDAVKCINYMGMVLQGKEIVFE